MMRVAFGAGDTIMQNRVMITVDQAASVNPTHQRGLFHILLRAKKTVSGDTIHVRLQDGFLEVPGIDTSSYRTGSRVEITSTNWILYHLGSVQIPSPGRSFRGNDFYDEYALIVQAQRASGGTGNLDLDCLCIVPYGEGLVYFSNGRVHTDLVNPKHTYVMMTPDNLVQAAGESPTLVDGQTISVQAHVMGGLPVGAGVAFLFGHDSDFRHGFGDECFIQIYAAHRWLIMRGNQ